MYYTEVYITILKVAVWSQQSLFWVFFYDTPMMIMIMTLCSNNQSPLVWVHYSHYPWDSWAEWVISLCCSLHAHCTRDHLCWDIGPESSWLSRWYHLVVSRLVVLSLHIQHFHPGQGSLQGKCASCALRSLAVGASVREPATKDVPVAEWLIRAIG